jgi:hypothetical protein
MKKKKEKEKKKESHGQERLVRLIMLALAVALIMVVLGRLADSGVKPSGEMKLPNLPRLDLGKIDPGEILGSKQPLVSAPEEATAEPIAEPVVNIQNQAENLIKLIKKLPEDQLAAVKKQLCKELCQEEN